MVKTAFTQLMRAVPRCELAPPPPPFKALPLAPRPNRSTHAVTRGTASWGGNLRTVFRMSVASEWARHVSSRRVSEECNAWMSVRVRELAGTASTSAL